MNSKVGTHPPLFLASALLLAFAGNAAASSGMGHRIDSKSTIRMARPGVAAPAISPVVPPASEGGGYTDEDVQRFEAATFWQLVDAMHGPLDEIRSSLPLITHFARNGVIDHSTIYDMSLLFPEDRLRMQARELLTAYAELLAFGWPVTESFVVDGMDPMQATQLGSRIAVGQRHVRPSDRMRINDSGTCQACSDPVDFVAPAPPAGSCFFLADGLDNGMDCDYISFPVTAGKRYKMTFCSGGAGADADMVLRLFDSNCIPLTSNDDGCAGGLSEIRWDAAVNDVWRLQIANAQVNYPDPTLYNLCITEEGDACDSCAAPSPVKLFPTTFCQFQSGNTQPTASCNFDYYMVFMEAGATYRYSTCPAPAALPPDPTCPGAANQAAGACNPALAWNPRIEIFALPANCVLGTELTLGAVGSGGCASNNQLPDFTFTAPATAFYEMFIGRENPAASPAQCANYGTYTIAYQRLSVGCASCSSGPYVNGVVPVVPDCNVCGNISGVIDSCNDEWIEFSLLANKPYEFTTCSLPGGCLGGSATPVTKLELYSAPACSLVAITGVNDFCSATGVKLLYTPLVDGIYRLHVAGVAGQVGPYNLTHRCTDQGPGCTAPTTITLAPGGGGTEPGTCQRTETFDVTSDGTLPIDYDITITPPAGGSAAPPHIVHPGVNTPDAADSFSSTLTHEGTFTITITASNSCGDVTQVFGYVLADTEPPLLIPPADRQIECGDPVPSDQPTVSDNCDPNPSVVLVSEDISAGGCGGEQVVTRTWQATDRSGNTSAQVVQVITSRDTLAPVLQPNNNDVVCLYPPNHNLYFGNVNAFSLVASDACSPPVTIIIVGITNSEEGLQPCGDGNQDPDVIFDPGTGDFFVRAERCGNDPTQNDGRRYQFVGHAVDACGNTSVDTVVGSILVPHDNADHFGCVEATF
jgi:hypothetical protein